MPADHRHASHEKNMALLVLSYKLSYLSPAVKQIVPGIDFEWKLDGTRAPFA